MIKLLFRFLKRIIFSVFTLYGLNLLISALDVVIPINLFTILLIAILGIPGLLSVISLFFLI